MDKTAIVTGGYSGIGLRQPARWRRRTRRSSCRLVPHKRLVRRWAVLLELSLKRWFTYNKRIAMVEPVFGNLKNKGMDRFTLRGKKKVNTHWQLFSLVHNIEKIATVGAL